MRQAKQTTKTQSHIQTTLLGGRVPTVATTGSFVINKNDYCQAPKIIVSNMLEVENTLTHVNSTKELTPAHFMLTTLKQNKLPVTVWKVAKNKSTINYNFVKPDTELYFLKHGRDARSTPAEREAYNQISAAERFLVGMVGERDREILRLNAELMQAQNNTRSDNTLNERLKTALRRSDERYKHYKDIAVQRKRKCNKYKAQNKALAEKILQYEQQVQEKDKNHAVQVATLQEQLKTTTDQRDMFGIHNDMLQKRVNANRQLFTYGYPSY
jgi:hypothetical protein